MPNKLEMDGNTIEVVSSETRKEILKYLNRRNMTVTELSRELDLSKSTVHEHLKKLKNAGFINKLDREGRKWVYYELTKKGKNLVGNRVQKILLFATSGITGVLGIHQLLEYLRTPEIPQEDQIMGAEATEVVVESSGGGIHLIAASVFFILAIVAFVYYWIRVR